MSKQRMSLKEEEMKRMVNEFGAALEDITNATRKLLTKISNIASKEDYQVINDLYNESHDFFGDELKQILKKSYNDWTQSDVSLVKLTQGKQAGEDAVGTAKKLEANLDNKIDGMFALPIPDKISSAAANPEIEPEKLIDICNHVKDYINQLDAEEEKHTKKIMDKAEDNQLYKSILGHVQTAYETSKKGYETQISNIDKVRENLEAIMNKDIQNISDINNEMKQQGESQAQNVKFPQPSFF